MKVLGRTTMLWIALTAFSAAIAIGGQQQSKFPEGPGRAILERACGTCHDAGSIANHRYATPGEYRDIVESMIGSGAQVSDAEKPVLVDYLFTSFGKKPEPGATPPPDPGKAILEAACTPCHGLDAMANHIYDSKGPYESLVDNMVAYGAPVTAAQKPVLIDYMFKTYGKK
jgi:cytochrome c5